MLTAPMTCTRVRADWVPTMDRAFALEGRGVWHAMTASLCQQLVGPVRLRSSLRLAVEHPDPLAKVSSTPGP